MQTALPLEQITEWQSRRHDGDFVGLASQTKLKLHKCNIKR